MFDSRFLYTTNMLLLCLMNLLETVNGPLWNMMKPKKRWNEMKPLRRRWLWEKVLLGPSPDNTLFSYCLRNHRWTKPPRVDSQRKLSYTYPTQSQHQRHQLTLESAQRNEFKSRRLSRLLFVARKLNFFIVFFGKMPTTHRRWQINFDCLGEMSGALNATQKGSAVDWRNPAD